jgi:hypothetical protein
MPPGRYRRYRPAPPPAARPVYRGDDRHDGRHVDHGRDHDDRGRGHDDGKHRGKGKH